MRKLIGILGLAMAALLSLSACGGGGGSPGNTTEQYSITLRADKTSLPTNINMVPPGIVSDMYSPVIAPYTTALYVEGRQGGRPIEGEDPTFGCNMSGGVSTGALFYLDGDPEHEDKDGNPAAYRAITLGANSGGASFFFHAYNQAGTARITCSVTDPRDNRVYSAYVDITVGGATGKPSSIQVIAEAPENGSIVNYVGTQGNLYNLRTSTAIQAYVWDDANQPVPNPSAPNLQVSIKAVGNAWLGARLQSGMQSGANIQVSTVAGVGSFTLSSGPNAGPILLELTADRYDNNVGNGIQDPVVHYWVVYAVDAIVDPLAVTSATLSATNGTAFAYALDATGGQPPYAWTISSGALPTGLSLDPSGIISGIPQANPGTYAANVQVTDSLGNTATGTVTIAVTGDLPPAPLHITSTSVSGKVGQPLSYILSAAGGTPPLTWTLAGTFPAGSGLTLNAASGVINGTPTAVDAAASPYPVAVSVSDSSSPALTATANITITIAP